MANALKFTDEGGKVNVALELVDGHALLFVRDTGVGISSDDLSLVFDRFRRGADPSTDHASGTGIGLALVHEYVELMGGSVDARSMQGFGSTFSVRIPISLAGPGGGLDPGRAGKATVVDDYDSGLVPVVPKSRAWHSAGSSDAGIAPLILVVDDNRDIHEYVTVHLEPGFRVAQAVDGRSALDFARRHTPDLIIADIMMPEMDGYELCSELRGDEVLRSVPIILLTARADEEDRIKGLEGGADDYLTKPFSVRELEVRVTNLILSRRTLREAFSRTIRVLPDEVDVKSRDETFVDQVLTELNRHLGDSYFGTDMLATELGLSRRQVERRVKDVLGRTPPDLLREMRLERSAQILKARPGTIAAVASAVGFRSASHFSVAFRKAYGMTPTEFVENAT